MITEQSFPVFIFIIVMGYLVGSLPTAYLIARLHHINIFEVGSGNMGGTNIARTMGPFWGVLTIVIDICKGVLAVLIARLILPDQQWTVTTVASIAVICGHNWSIFATLLYAAARKSTRMTIQGGKGAATAFGTLLMIAPVQIIIGMLTLGALMVYRTRYMSLGVLMAFTLAIIGVIVLVLQGILPTEYLLYALALSILLPLRFRENIQRLISGTERRVGDRAST